MNTKRPVSSFVIALLIVLAWALISVACSYENPKAPIESQLPDTNYEETTQETNNVSQTVATTETVSEGVGTSTTTEFPSDQTEREESTNEVALPTETTAEEITSEETTFETITSENTTKEETKPMETTKLPKETVEETTVETEPQPEILTPSEAVLVSPISDLRDPCVLKANNRYFVLQKGTYYENYLYGRGQYRLCPQHHRRLPP